MRNTDATPTNATTLQGRLELASLRGDAHSTPLRQRLEFAAVHGAALTVLVLLLAGIVTSY